MKDYLEIMYNRGASMTDYPSRFVRHLVTSFGFEKDQEILEIGCGTGDFLKAFRAEGFSCRGVDLSDRSVRSLKGVQKCDILKEKLPYDSGMFDVVYHKSLIEHLSDPSNLMSETMRVLRPEGKIIILTPDWKSQMKTFYNDYTHVRPYTVDSLIDLMKSYGFEEVQSELFYQLPMALRHSYLKVFGKILQYFCSVESSRKMGKLRWLVELMVLGMAVKRRNE